MGRKTIYSCDRCGGEFSEDNPSQGVTNVQVTYGGNGAMKDSRQGDYCRECYGGIVVAINSAMDHKA